MASPGSTAASDEHLVCATCGREVLKRGDLSSGPIPSGTLRSAVYQYDLHVLDTPVVCYSATSAEGSRFDVLLANVVAAAAKFHFDSWDTPSCEHRWFPGYIGRAVYCASCPVQPRPILGWAFSCADTSHSRVAFFALIITKLRERSSLLQVPTSQIPTTSTERGEALLRDPPAFIALLDAMRAVADIQYTPYALRMTGGEQAHVLRDMAGSHLPIVGGGIAPLQQLDPPLELCLAMNTQRLDSTSIDSSARRGPRERPHARLLPDAVPRRRPTRRSLQKARMRMPPVSETVRLNHEVSEDDAPSRSRSASEDSEQEAFAASRKQLRSFAQKVSFNVQEPLTPRPARPLQRKVGRGVEVVCLPSSGATRLTCHALRELVQLGQPLRARTQRVPSAAVRHR